MTKEKDRSLTNEWQEEFFEFIIPIVLLLIFYIAVQDSWDGDKKVHPVIGVISLFAWVVYIHLFLRIFIETIQMFAAYVQEDHRLVFKLKNALLFTLFALATGIIYWVLMFAALQNITVGFDYPTIAQSLSNFIIAVITLFYMPFLVFGITKAPFLVRG